MLRSVGFCSGLLGSAEVLFNSIQFSFICIAPFYNRTVSSCFKESETQSQNNQVSTVTRKNSLLTEKNLEHDLAYREEPSS